MATKLLDQAVGVVRPIALSLTEPWSSCPEIEGVEDRYRYQLCVENGDMEIGAFREWKDIFWQIFIVIKCLLFLPQFANVARRYKSTHNSWKMFEIWFMIFRFIEILMLIPVYFYKEINALFFIFTCNSICMYSMSYMLQQRVAVSLEYKASAIRRNQVLFGALCLAVLLNYLTPDLWNPNGVSFWFSCNARYVYRKSIFE